MKKLVEFFPGEYVIHHEVGLPLRMEIDDADYSDDEYYDKVIMVYHNKPPNYKALLIRALPQNY